MNQSNREEWLSADANRIGNLSGREKMDQLKLRSVRADFYDPATNAFDDFTAVKKAAQGTPLAGLTKPPSLEGIAAVFDMNIGAGEAQMPGTSASADISDYQLLRWDAQKLTWPLAGTPDATNPLICLICGTPADVPTDLQSRNILVDVLTRATVPANVYKTSNPVATLSVVAGAAAAAPVAPAVPAGALALFEVYVPPLAPDSTTFLPVRRAWRQIEFPGTSQHGIVKGCVPLQPAGGLILPVAGLNRIVIDGELLTFSGAFWIAAVADTVTPPTAAPAGNDKPLYLYVCGGRNQPAMDYTTAGFGGGVVPVRFVISATPPDSAGYPTASLGVATPAMVFPRAACCYIGLAFYGAGGTTIVGAYYEGDWIHASTLHNFEQLDITTAVIVYTAISMPTVPAVSTAMRVRSLVTGAASTLVRIAISAGTAGDIMILDPSLWLIEKTVDTVAKSTLYYNDLVAPDSLRIRCVGFNMNVPRLAR
jgi:hypothetical protein